MTANELHIAASRLANVVAHLTDRAGELARNGDAVAAMQVYEVARQFDDRRTQVLSWAHRVEFGDADADALLNIEAGTREFLALADWMC
jgi:hypothetical protein